LIKQDKTKLRIDTIHSRKFHEQTKIQRKAREQYNKNRLSKKWRRLADESKARAFGKQLPRELEEGYVYKKKG